MTEKPFVKGKRENWDVGYKKKFKHKMKKIAIEKEELDIEYQKRVYMKNERFANPNMFSSSIFSAENTLKQQDGLCPIGYKEPSSINDQQESVRIKHKELTSAKENVMMEL